MTTDGLYLDKSNLLLEQPLLGALPAKSGFEVSSGNRQTGTLPNLVAFSFGWDGR